MSWALLVQTQFLSSMFSGVNEHFSETDLPAIAASDCTDDVMVPSSTSLMDIKSFYGPER